MIVRVVVCAVLLAVGFGASEVRQAWAERAEAEERRNVQRKLIQDMVTFAPKKPRPIVKKTFPRDYEWEQDIQVEFWNYQVRETQRRALPSFDHSGLTFTLRKGEGPVVFATEQGSDEVWEGRIIYGGHRMHLFSNDSRSRLDIDLQLEIDENGSRSHGTLSAKAQRCSV